MIKILTIKNIQLKKIGNKAKGEERPVKVDEDFFVIFMPFFRFCLAFSLANI